jgi:hypothetical protein
VLVVGCLLRNKLRRLDRRRRRKEVTDDDGDEEQQKVQGKCKARKEEGQGEEGVDIGVGGGEEEEGGQRKQDISKTKEMMEDQEEEEEESVCVCIGKGGEKKRNIENYVTGRGEMMEVSNTYLMRCL